MCNSEFIFDYHIHDICKNAEQELNAILSIRRFRYFAEKYFLLNEFFYC